MNGESSKELFKMVVLSHGTYPALTFGALYLIFWGVGIFCILVPPTARTEVASIPIPDTANCYRVRRSADYVTVEVQMGVPSRRTSLLLRLDTVKQATEASIRIFSERVIESQTFACNATTDTCHDTILLTQGGPNAEMAQYVVEFEYVNGLVEASTPGAYARTALDLDGELFASVGRTYWLTATHLCVNADNEYTNNMWNSTQVVLDNDQTVLNANIHSDNTLQTSGAHIGALSATLFGNSAIRDVYSDGNCNASLSTVDLFPSVSSIENIYLSLGDVRLYEREPAQIQQRRRLVELGITCAATLETYDRAFVLYDTDCGHAFSTCRADPSFPYRQFSTLSFVVHYASNNSDVQFVLAREPTLLSIPGLASPEDAVSLAVARLLLIVLAAAVMWVRADRVTSNSYWLYKHCINTIHGVGKNYNSDSNTKNSIIEDAMLGLLAVSARFAVVLTQCYELQSDNQSRVCVIQIIASTLSFANWIVRYFGVSPNIVQILNSKEGKMSPLIRLGGSMAVVDATSAVLLALSDPPLLLSTIQRFDATARLLSGVLISLVVYHRCLFGCACNALNLGAYYIDPRFFPDKRYQWIVWSALLSWAVQILSIAVSLTDLVATPVAFSLSRGVVGPNRIIGIAVFHAIMTASLPRLMHTCVKLASK